VMPAERDYFGMANKVKTKGKVAKPTKTATGRGAMARLFGTKKVVSGSRKGRSDTITVEKGGAAKAGSHNAQQQRRRDSLRRILQDKRQEIQKEIREDLEQSMTEDQQRRLEGMDSGDQALMDLEQELGISLTEMRNRRRQLIEEALIRLEEGFYGLCADCGVQISEKRLAAVPFAKLCVECQSREELLEKIQKEEDRD